MDDLADAVLTGSISELLPVLVSRAPSAGLSPAGRRSAGVAEVQRAGARGQRDLLDHGELAGRARPPTAGGRSGRTDPARLRPSRRAAIGSSRCGISTTSGASKSRRKAHDLVEGHRVAQGQVVDHGQAEHEVGPHPVDEGAAAPASATRAQATGRPGRARAAGCGARPPSAAAGRGGRPRGDRRRRRRRARPRPRRPRARTGRRWRRGRGPSARRGRAVARATNSAFASRSRVRVVAAVAVARPRRRRGLPLEPLDGPLQVGHLGVDDLGTEARPLQLASGRLGRRRRRRSGTRPGRAAARG